MIDSARDVDPATAGQGETHDAVPRAFMIFRSLTGFAVMLAALAGSSVALSSLGGTTLVVDAAVLVLIPVAVFAVSPLIFRLLGRRDIEHALMRWHGIWVAVATVVSILVVIYPFLKAVDADQLEDIYYYISRLSDLTEEMKEIIGQDNNALRNRIDELFDRIEFLGHTLRRNILFNDVSSGAYLRDIMVVSLLALMASKLIQAVAAWVPWTQRILTPKPLRPAPLEPDLLAILSDQRRWLVRELTRRAVQIRARAAVILLVIIALILGGIISIYLAGDLVSSDAQKTTPLEQIRSIIMEYKKEQKAAEEKLTETKKSLAEYPVNQSNCYQQQSQYPRKTTPPNTEWEGLESIKNTETSDSSDQSNKISDDCPKIAELEELSRQLNEEISDLKEIRNNIELKLANGIDSYVFTGKQEPADIRLLIASGVTRFGILIVVIYLVQILLGVYRYSLRLAAFYAARADALTAGLNRSKGLGNWGPEFLPEMIDFGRDPVTPARYIVDVMSAYLSRRANQKGGGGSDQR